ncbi:helix-turn-helix domain-containing protein [Thermococcus alcaliphilus]|uniref:helix-turn-helix domain-containing protein n=1 Tax=Thermococcus alcaliphilus TaxID=139207 RepID=UPI0020904479|nr:helix-turn-helix domain-containing protein [Thermococcus alcaliphilus]MCO6042050.1 helix-turn-helix domain-containing protein [Thermococcus alcaliphilus]
MPMKRIKFKFPNSSEQFSDFKWFIGAIEWAYGDTYFMIGDEIIKLVEIKFKEEANPQDIVNRVKELPYVEDIKLIPLKNGHYYMYTRAKLPKHPNSEEAFDVLELQKRGFVIFEKGTMTPEESFLYVVCEENFIPEIISILKKTYNAEVASIEDYTPQKSIFPKLTEKQLKTLLVAYKSGYFDNPRRITLRELAQILGLSPSTVKEHLRKAERKILEELIG